MNSTQSNPVAQPVADIKQQVLNMVRYIAANPKENITFLSSDVINSSGDVIARFNNHLQALTAVRTIRQEMGIH